VIVALQGCVIVSLQGCVIVALLLRCEVAWLLRCNVAWLLRCKVAWLLRWRLQDCCVARLRDCSVAWLLRYKVAWLRNANRGVRSVGPVSRTSRGPILLRPQRTYLTILKRAWSANFKMVWYVLRSCDLCCRAGAKPARAARRTGPTDRTPLYWKLAPPSGLPSNWAKDGTPQQQSDH
jgi:hypothetical protein